MDRGFSELSVSDLRDFHSRIEDKLLRNGVIDKIPEWICENTTLNGKPWSFKDHEFQVAIARETAHEMVCVKCSQVGLSELQVRKTLAFLAIRQGTTAIYVLPHNKFAAKFAKGRVDPVISGSEKLKKLIVAASDSSEMKMFGYSFLYMGGASNDSSAISIPAQVLAQDEYDFCNPQVLSVYDSRLRHAENGGYKWRFSTPTLPGYGISLEYDQSSRGRYLCKCSHCEKWSAPDFYKSVVIPGWNKPFEKFEKEDLIDTAFDVDSAYIACEHCGAELDTSLSDPSRREWVHEFPTIDKKGYAVRPFDLMKYNSTKSLIRQLKGYERRSDYNNFVHGITHKSKDSQIDEAMVRKCSTLDAVFVGSGFVMGVDVGKTVHVTVGRREGRTFKIVWYGKIKHDDENVLNWIIGKYLDFGCHRMVIDSAPDVTLWKNLIYKFGDEVNPCVYSKDNAKKSQYFELKEEPSAKMVVAMRTRGIDRLVEYINNGKTEFPRLSDLDDSVTFLQQLQGMKRVSQYSESGDMTSSWVKTGPDHYFHSTFYCLLASDIDGDEYDIPENLAAPTGVVGATINYGSNVVPVVGGNYMEALRSLGLGP